MKKQLFIVVGIVLSLAINSVFGQDSASEKPAKKPSLNAEQKALRKELTEKYDANKTGRLDKAERAKMTAEDLEKWYTVSPADKARDDEAKAKAEAKKEQAAAKKAEADAKRAAAKATKEKVKKEKE